ncbi:hypothetical protein [Rhodonellum sp.]|uniref:hypothetical protein n=1 Tax=Rhodonellum sp. TaxID=2231180 RepID=UPI00271A4412|nr:hypothetical protein [Rhodonellum sp.]MDO9551547.1 hypothetical protein [Rhodonellum sp.]
MKSLIKYIVTLRNYIVFKKHDFFSKYNNSNFPIDSGADFLVSIASYPKRSHLLPAVFEALRNQTVLPKKWILVLSEEEWPGLKLPLYLNNLEKKGIEIIWVQNNTFAVKKLIPVVEKYPELGVVTLDDDIIYHSNLLSELIKGSLIYPSAIVGFVGKTMIRKGNVLNMMFREKGMADTNTPFKQVYLIGWGGIYYPSNSLESKAFDIKSITKIVPGRGSDLWFWAAAIAKNTQQVCLGMPTNFNLGIPIPQNIITSPKDTPGKNIMEDRFQKTIDYFGIREKLLKELPDQC